MRTSSALIKDEGAQPLEKVLGWVEQLGCRFDLYAFAKATGHPSGYQTRKYEINAYRGGHAGGFWDRQSQRHDPDDGHRCNRIYPGLCPTGADQRLTYRTVFRSIFPGSHRFTRFYQGAQPADGIQRSLGKETLTPIRQLMPAIPAHVESTLNRALSLRPEERFKDIDEFIQALKDPEFTASAGPVILRDASKAGLRKKANNKKIWLVGLGGLAVILAGAAAAVLFLLPDRTLQPSQTTEPTIDFNPGWEPMWLWPVSPLKRSPHFWPVRQLQLHFQHPPKT